MNKADINNEIVLMRKTVRQGKVHIIRKLVREIRQLKEKKLPDERINKFKEKADRLYEELAIIKKLNFDEISKYALSTQEDPHKMLSDTKISLKDRAINRLAAYKIINDKVKSIKMKYNIDSNIEKILEPGKKKLRKMKHIEGKEKKKQQKLDKTLEDTASTKRKQWLEKHNPASLETSEIADNTSEFENFSTREQENCGTGKINKKQLSNPTANKNLDILPENSKADSFVNNTLLNEEMEKKYGSEHDEREDENNMKENEEIDSNLEDIVSDNAMTTVDDFFLTDAGSHYKSTFVPKIIEQVETNDGLNRQQRRAQMFGNKIKKNKPTSMKNQPYTKQHKSNIIYKPNKQKSNDLDIKPRAQTKTSNKVSESIQEQNTALHPSWEAKKKQKIQIAAFQGKKITFDD